MRLSARFLHYFKFVSRPCGVQFLQSCDEKVRLEAVSHTLSSPMYVKSGAGILVKALLIRLRRTQISRARIVFLALKFQRFAPFGAEIQIHRTN
jgi:hypothetical protein